MSEIKWIKLSIDVFDNRKIRQIESMPDGDALIVIWFKLLVLSGEINDGGFVYFTKDIPFTDQLLATQFNKPITTIQLALATFAKFGMIEIVDDLILVSNWEKYQNVNEMERIREQSRKSTTKYREKKQLEAHCANVTSQSCHRDVTVTSQSCHSDVTVTQENKNKNKNKNKNNIYIAQNEDANSCANDEQCDDLRLSCDNRSDANATDDNTDSDFTGNNKKANQKKDYGKDFEELWAAYPRKRDKGKAYAAYKARLNDGWSEEELLDATVNYASECKKEHREEKYTKLAATFFSVNTPFMDYLPKEKPKDEAKDDKPSRALYPGGRTCEIIQIGI